MPTPSRGISIKLFPEDRERFLRFSLATLEAIQDEFGEDALSGNSVKGKRLAQILWYGLRSDAERNGEATTGDGAVFTPEWISEQVDMTNIKEIGEAMGEAFGNSKRTTVVVPQEPPAQ